MLSPSAGTRFNDQFAAVVQALDELLLNKFFGLCAITDTEEVSKVAIATIGK